jgi:hypothetical protein
MITSLLGRYLNTEQHRHSMPQVGFKPTIPAFERSKTVHALDRVVTVIDSTSFSSSKTEGRRRMLSTHASYSGYPGFSNGYRS